MVDYERILELDEEREYSRDHAITLCLDNLDLDSNNKSSNDWSELFNGLHRTDQYSLLLRLIQTQGEYILRCMERGDELIEVPKIGSFRFKKSKKAYQELRAVYDKDAETINDELLRMKQEGEFIEVRRKNISK